MFCRPVLPLILFAQIVLLPSAALAAATETSHLEGLEYRNIGPWRGGRVTAVTGVPGQPQLYYMGAAGGGVWKTHNAGASWENLSDAYFKVGTIGAIAVAASDHKVIYVGTGEAPIRGVTTSHGDGVWKSTDGGQSWQHIGLPESGQIARIQIHPDDADTAWVAVQGQIWGPNEQRGVFKTSDGGQSWQHVLKVGPSTGATDLVLDPGNPRTLYAAMWHHGRKPWFIQSGATDGGIFKSTDGGESWNKLGGGLPQMIGKIGIAVSADNPQRVYAIVEAEPERGGLWRSEDGGANWKLINGHRVLHSRAWYYTHIAADPSDENTVYVLNVPMLKSIDGGENWSIVKTPHSDHHDHWINPDDSRNMINGNDGGATITFDGGATWSTLNNQPTAQFYRVSTDNQLPFRVYGGQQDNTTIGIASRSLYAGIGVEDYFDVGGGESAHIGLDPDDPGLIYATTINGTLTEYDHRSGLERVIIPYPEVVWGKDSRDLRYRANWNAPVALSPHDPAVIYYGTQYVLKSTDRGMNWTEISPDLTRNDTEKQGRNGGPLTPENVGAEFYNTIFYMVESSREPGHIWVGSDDGLVHLSRDGGNNWEDISPPHRGEAQINAIELSPHADGTAWLAVTGYKLNDFSPYIYHTSDYGKRWQRIDKGLPEDTFVRVVREDPRQAGLLYAGTEAGMFVSYDAGDSWASLALNLPPVPITDLTIRQDTLVVATQGRGFWLLDDLFVVRQAAAWESADELRLLAADNTLLWQRRGWNSEAFEGANPKPGVALYYYLPEQPEQAIRIDIHDAAGELVRSYASSESELERCLEHNEDPRSPYDAEYPPTKAGLNVWHWNGRREHFPCVRDITLFAGLHGAKVPPGQYTASIAVDGASRSVTFSTSADPRVQTDPAAMAEWSARLDETSSLLQEMLLRLGELRQARSQVTQLMQSHPAAAELQTMATAAIASIDAWDHRIIQPLHETLEDEDAWETRLAGQVRFVLDVIEASGAPVTAGSLQRLADLQAEWSELRDQLQTISKEQLQPIEQWARDNRVAYVAMPDVPVSGNL